MGPRPKPDNHKQIRDFGARRLPECEPFPRVQSNIAFADGSSLSLDRADLRDLANILNTRSPVSDEVKARLARVPKPELE